MTDDLDPRSKISDGALPPPSAAGIRGGDSHPVAAHGSRDLLPYAQLGLRLLGVMLFFQGVATIAGTFAQALLLARTYEASGESPLSNLYSSGLLILGVPHILIGLYLMLGGRWILINVFSPSPRDDFEERDAAGPSP